MAHCLNGNLSEIGSFLKIRDINGMKNFKLLTTVFLIMLSIGAVRGQTAAPIALPDSVSQGGYFLIYPQVPIITVHFDPNSSDIAKKENATTVSSRFNHDGKAFASFVRSAPTESNYDTVVDYAQREKNVDQYKTNVKSGKWREFVNGE